MAVLGYFYKCNMSFNMLTNSLVSAIQLHGTLHIECSRICYISRDSNEHGPFLVQDDSIVLWMSWAICECAVDVLDHYVLHTILFQTTFGMCCRCPGPFVDVL